MVYTFCSYEQLEQDLPNLNEIELVDFTTKNLKTFIAANFAGGQVSNSDDSIERSNLSIGIYAPVKNAKSLAHLYANKICLIGNLDNEFGNLPTRLSLIAFRTILSWQKIMPEPINELNLLLKKLAQNCNENELDSEDRTIFFLEQLEVHMIYFDHDAAEVLIGKAMNNCGLSSLRMSGKLGKRTRFQQKEISQLFLNATVKNKIIDLPEEKDIPINVSLDDDTVLEKINFTEDQEDTNSFSSEQLAVILARCRIDRRTEPVDDILLEKCHAYLSLITSQKRCWAVQCSALLLRSDLERHSKRRVERACSQSELISKLMEGIDDNTSIDDREKRVKYVLASGLVPSWGTKVIHAEILRSLGVTSEALLIFEQLELWDHVIECYKSLGQLEKANNLIHELLKTRPNDSMLYVYLGEINQKEEYYHKAIEISDGRNAKAYKALGHMLLMRNQYEEAWNHLKRSVEIQPIQFGTWFNAGHVAFKLEKYKDSISCYHRCVCLEPDHFEAWNNLSASYIRINEKHRAKFILQEALKFNYEHAKVWENYLLVCVDTADFGQAIQAFHRLLDLNKKVEEDEILELMANELLKQESREDLTEEEKAHLATLKRDLIKLFARISSSKTLAATGWTAYAELKRSTNDIDEFSSHVHLLERAYAAGLRNVTANDALKQLAVLKSALRFGRAKIELANLKGTEEALKEAKMSVTLTVRTRLSIIEKLLNGTIPAEAEEVINETKEFLKSVL